MKKKLFAITLCTVLSLSVLTGCRGSSVSKLANTAKNIADNATATATPIPTPTPTPAPKETSMALKKTGKIGDWKFKVSKVVTKKKINTSKYISATAAKGNLLVIASVSVTNNGKEESTFLPRVGRENTMLTAKLIYKDGYEYQPSSITGYDKDLIGKNIEPLSKKSGVVAFDVPKKVAKNLKTCKIRIGTKGEAVIYPAK